MISAPSFQKNVLSVSQVTKANSGDIVFTQTRGYIIPHNKNTPEKPGASFHVHKGLYRLQLNVTPSRYEKSFAAIVTP